MSRRFGAAPMRYSSRRLGQRGVEGMIAAAKYAREKGIPYFGLCLGMQVAVIEFARNVLGLKRRTAWRWTRRRPTPSST